MPQKNESLRMTPAMTMTVLRRGLDQLVRTVSQAGKRQIPPKARKAHATELRPGLPAFEVVNGVEFGEFGRLGCFKAFRSG